MFKCASSSRMIAYNSVNNDQVNHKTPLFVILSYLVVASTGARDFNRTQMQNRREHSEDAKIVGIQRCFRHAIDFASLY